MKEPRVVVFVRCDPQANFGELEAEYGVTINEPEGPIRTAYLPIKALDPLSEHKGVHRIGSTRTAKPRLDIALPRVKIPQFRKAQGLNGNGVIVGIVDTGIDPNHPDFTGRILRIWDQTLAGPGVREGSFGLELTGPAIVASRDTEGHGSHVAGIATGADATFNGIAPAADIVFVKTDFNTGHIANGIQYIFRVAREMNRPAVINLSLGSHFDGHDGSDDLSTFIDLQSGAGRIVCCAAGNEGEDNIHAQAKIAAKATESIRFLVPAGTGGAVLSGWYGPQDEFAIAIEGPNGQRTPFQPIIKAGNPAKSFTIASSQVIIATPDIDAVNGDHHFEVQISGVGAGTLQGGRWKLLVRGSHVKNGLLDVWASDFQSGATIQFADAVSNEMKIGSPGASAQAITVASFTTRIDWIDKAGAKVGLHFPVEDLSPFSSPGPLRKGQQKPDVAAPGAVIASALSADSSPDQGFIISPTMRMDLGTSMATPFITGVVALLLEKDAKLSPADIKKRFNAASRIPGQKANTFQAPWGFGLIDASLL
jgi:subtilisin family serine protease